MFSANNLDQYFEELEKKSWTLIPIDSEWALQLRRVAEQHDKNHRFKDAGISQKSSQSKSIRNDRTYWLEPESKDLADIEQKTLSKLSELMSGLKNFFRVSLREYECHYAIYEPGHYYQRHSDTTTQNNKRFFSFIIYLNPAWDKNSGGLLRAYAEAEKNMPLFEITPELGQMIIFHSHIEHEVLPTQASRYSLTGWMRT